MTLTREQKIKRAVTRLNNRTNRDFPLLAPLLQTNKDEQKTRYDEIDAAHAEYCAKLDAGERGFYERGIAYREKARELYSPDDFAAMDVYFKKVLEGMGNAYFADYWRKALEKATA